MFIIRTPIHSINLAKSVELTRAAENALLREPPLLQQMDDKLLEITSKFQFFNLTSVKKVLVYQ